MMMLVNYFLFPGMLFGACVGLFAGWVDRKLTARIQWRVGPPWYQNFMDIAKLFLKETIVPEGAGATFILAPFFGLLGVGLVAAIIGMALTTPGQGFIGDLIVVIYLLVLPAIALIVGASASRNPLASTGASREMKMVLGYELPFVIAVIAVVIRSQGALRLGAIIGHQAAGSNIFSWSGCAAFIVMIFCMQAKLGFVPFDAAEAEQELMAGTLIEYSGPLLAVFKLTKALMLYVMPLFVIILFMGKDMSALFLAGKYLALLTTMVLIKNTNPRLRIDQALRFFWGWLMIPAVASLVFALIGI
ncbi:MAG: complex I subunit 1 family protein [Candidatus Omnitrophota bacterium]